jgi:branched-chain amino acid transport system substrate-binding protein
MRRNITLGKRVLTVLAVLAVIGMLAGPWPGFAADKTVKVGNIEPLSGPSASVGQQGKCARDLAVEEINAAGGIKSLGGAKIEMVYADSESKPEKGTS